MNALIKQSTVYAGIPEMDKVDECFKRCFQLDESSVDALIHKARVNYLVCVGVKKGVSCHYSE